MRLGNGHHGYGIVTKLLHWLTVVAIAAQFAIGWTMEPDTTVAERAQERVDAFEERGEGRAQQQGEAAEDRFEAEVERREDAAKAAEDAVEDEFVGNAFTDVLSGTAFRDGLASAEAHVLTGLLVLVLGLVRLLWRRTTALPPWAEHLTERERHVESWLEKALLTLLLVVPATGLLLVVGRSDWLPVHVSAQIALMVVVGLHVGLVLKHTVVRRNRHLARMT